MNIIKNCNEFVNSFNNYTLNELKSYTFKFYNNIYNFDDFVMKYQNEENCIKFYKNLLKLGYNITDKHFYYYCNYAYDTSMIDWYIDNIIDINSIEYKKLNIDNHQTIKKIISRGYNRDTIDFLCFVPYNNDISICFCYYELLKHNYKFNNNYILQTVIDISIQNEFNKILNHPYIKDFFNNLTSDKYKVSDKDLEECNIKYHQPMDIMISNISIDYPLSFDEYYQLKID